MADRNIVPANGNGKTTFIYGLIDPRTQELRYVGKTVVTPTRRLCVHKWRAKAEPQKNHSMAWIFNLARAGLEPDVFTIEEVAPHENWIEREQFWIAYFRAIGANLCNHSIGGESGTGVKPSPETIAKRIRRGTANGMYGKKMSDKTRKALREGTERLRADPVRYAEYRRNQLKSITPEFVAASITRLAAFHADPIRHAETNAKRALASRLPKHRLRVGSQSKSLWTTDREKIIAAQNVGKGAEWKRKHSELGKKRSMNPQADPFLSASRKLWKLNDEDTKRIRLMIAAGESNLSIAARFGVDSSLISHIKCGRRRPEKI